MHFRSLSQPPARVVILDLFRLGDQIYNLAFATALQRAFPAARVSLISSPLNSRSSLPELLGFETRSIDTPLLHPGWTRRPKRLAAFRRELALHFQSIDAPFLCIDPRGGLLTRLLTPVPSGSSLIQHQDAYYDSWRDRLLGYSRDHVFVAKQKLLGALGVSPQFLPWPFLSDKFRAKCKGHHVCLLPEASLRGKEWPVNHWIALQEALTSHGWSTTVVTSSGSDFERRANASLKNVWHGSIREFGDLLGSCQSVIAADSFGGHFAAAIGVPALSLFGVTDPDLWKPWGQQNIQLRKARAQNMRFTRRCIEQEGPKLMAEITPNEVLTEFLSWQDCLNTHSEMKPR